ncbi:hypothetical protein P5611_015890 [Bacillus subtilis]
METKKYVRIKKARSLRNWYSVRIGKMYIVIGENEIEYITHVGVVLKEDAELIVTEKRKAAVGERVLVTNAITESGAYKTGDICTVWSVYPHGVITVREHRYYLVAEEYEVVVNSEVKYEEADEMKIDLNAMGYDELMAHGDAVMEAIKKRTFQEGFRAAKQVQRKLAKMNAEKSAQARRDEIVEQAKADVEALSNYGNGVWHETEDKWSFATCNVEFVVNRNKRTVVALLTGFHSGFVYARGIAKAAPDDCFNVHIGKAIALRRALGLAVPDEYLNAPQPTEVRVGDVVRGKYSETYYPLWCEDEIVDVRYEATIKEIADGKYRYVEGGYDFIDDADLTIIDDSREEVGGE